MVESTAAKLAKLVGRRIAELRRARGRTQQAVADSAGMKIDVYRRIERGSRPIELWTVARVLEALGARAEDVITLSEPDYEPKLGRPRRKTSS